MKYIRIRYTGCSASGKTGQWSVIANEGYKHLGQIRWYAPWRRYCFFPVDRTLFEQYCLRDIADTVERLTRDHKRTTYSKGAYSVSTDPVRLSH